MFDLGLMPFIVGMQGVGRLHLRDEKSPISLSVATLLMQPAKVKIHLGREG